MKRCKQLEWRIKQIQYCLIRAKVDLEYGMGFSKNPHLISCANEIEKACDFAFAKSEEYDV
jgi:hypothetical protein